MKPITNFWDKDFVVAVVVQFKIFTGKRIASQLLTSFYTSGTQLDDIEENIMTFLMVPIAY